MSHSLLRDARLYELLAGVDQDLAGSARKEGCPCGGRLHGAHYPRKPRGLPQAVEPQYRKRFSFCCARHDCRQRLTPPSVRFLGRRLYVAVVVVLVTAMASGVTPKRATYLRELVGEELSERTLARWRGWWQSELPNTSFWREHGARLMPPVAATQLPMSLLDRFGAGDDRDRLIAMLRFIAPVTTSSSPSRPSNSMGCGHPQSTRVEGSKNQN